MFISIRIKAGNISEKWKSGDPEVPVGLNLKNSNVVNLVFGYNILNADKFSIYPFEGKIIVDLPEFEYVSTRRKYKFLKHVHISVNLHSSFSQEIFEKCVLACK